MHIASKNPHDQSIVGEMLVANEKEIVAVIKRSRIALDRWRQINVVDRCEIILNYAKLLEQHKSEIANTITQEMGRPLKHTNLDIDWELEYVRYYATTAPKVYSKEVLSNTPEEYFELRHEPHGVVVCIAPWNFPISMAHSGILPALLGGNTVVFKPSEITSLSQGYIQSLLEEAGLPRDVLQTVYGSGDVGRQLLNQEINMVWFTGSSKVGRSIYKKCGERFIKALCEMGGSSAALVFDDADFDNALNSIFFSRFNNSGQTCKAVKRVFVHKSLLERFTEALINRLAKTKLGNPQSDVDLGPVASQQQLSVLNSQVKDAVKKGAHILIGGGKSKKTELRHGNYFEPTVLTNITSEMRVMQEEVFGPILPIISFDTENDVVRMANATPFGLTNEIFTCDPKRAERIIPLLESGVVAINTDRFYRPYCPIGGVKQSGMGREYGEIGMKEFVQTKLIAINPLLQ